MIGDAREDADFGGGSDRVRYSVQVAGRSGPYAISVELRYQPIGFRWAHNLRGYTAAETQRFVEYYDSMSSASVEVLAAARATTR